MKTILLIAFQLAHIQIHRHPHAVLAFILLKIGAVPAAVDPTRMAALSLS